MSAEGKMPDKAEFPMRCPSCQRVLLSQYVWRGHQTICTGGKVVDGGDLA